MNYLMGKKLAVNIPKNYFTMGKKQKYHCARQHFSLGLAQRYLDLSNPKFAIFFVFTSSKSFQMAWKAQATPSSVLALVQKYLAALYLLLAIYLVAVLGRSDLVPIMQILQSGAILCSSSQQKESSSRDWKLSTLQTRIAASLPLQQRLRIDLQRYWPAVSKQLYRAYFLQTGVKSTTRVVAPSSLQSLYLQRVSNLVLPTEVIPSMMTLYAGSWGDSSSPTLDLIIQNYITSKRYTGNDQAQKYWLRDGLWQNNLVSEQGQGWLLPLFTRFLFNILNLLRYSF